ncbi:MAG: OmpA family protein [Thiohalocapsa sp.]
MSPAAAGPETQKQTAADPRILQSGLNAAGAFFPGARDTEVESSAGAGRATGFWWRGLCVGLSILLVLFLGLFWQSGSISLEPLRLFLDRMELPASGNSPAVESATVGSARSADASGGTVFSEQESPERSNPTDRPAPESAGVDSSFLRDLEEPAAVASGADYTSVAQQVDGESGEARSERLAAALSEDARNIDTAPSVLVELAAEPNEVPAPTAVEPGATDPAVEPSMRSTGNLQPPRSFPLGDERAQPDLDINPGIVDADLAQLPDVEVAEPAPGLPENKPSTLSSAPGPSDLRRGLDSPMSRLEDQLRATTVSVQRIEDGRLIADLGDKVQFENGSVTLDSDALTFLEVLAGYVREALPLKVRVIGHTDHQGRAEVNARLSERRAEAVAQFIAANTPPGIDLSFEGRGETEPRVELTQEWQLGPSVNRRIELDVAQPSVGNGDSIPY